ncbi:MAG: hypothetical protein ACLFUK_01875 [Halanaerobium sp.]
MANLIVALVILIIIAGAAAKIIIEKKKGAQCVGCPYSGANEDNCSYNVMSEKISENPESCPALAGKEYNFDEIVLED